MDQGFHLHSDEIHHIETADTISPVSGRVDLHIFAVPLVKNNDRAFCRAMGLVNLRMQQIGFGRI
jgi:hypothetical protein